MEKMINENICNVKEKMLQLFAEINRDLQSRGYIVYDDVNEEAELLSEKYGYCSWDWAHVLLEISVPFNYEAAYDINLALELILEKHKHKYGVELDTYYNKIATRPLPNLPTFMSIPDPYVPCDYPGSIC